MKMSSKTDWQSIWVKRVREIKKTKYINKPKRVGSLYRKVVKKGSNEFGARFANKNPQMGRTPSDPASMENMIVNAVFEKQLMAVVGGRIKTHISKNYNDGQVTAGKKVYGIGDKTHSLLKKLDTGKARSDYRKHHRPRDWLRFKSPKYKARNFMGRGRMAAMGYVNKTMSDTLAKLIGRAVNRHIQKQGNKVA